MHSGGHTKKGNTKMKGIVKKWFVQKGSGWITPDDGGEDVFVSFRNVQLPGFRKLYEGEKVSFQKQIGEKGDFADQVVLLEDDLEKGRVLEFDGDEGLIQPETAEDPIRFEGYDVQSPGYPEFEEKELVRFRRITAGAAQKAVRVEKLDKRRPLEKFALLHQLDMSLDFLAKLTGESWNYRQKPATYAEHPILENYIYNTFRKLKRDDEILYATDRRAKKWASFNTGLATSDQDEIFACFSEARKKENGDSTLERPKWYFEGFYTKTQGPMACFSPLPDLANYFSNGAELIYDTSRELRTRDHIFRDRKARFLEIPGLPEALQKEDSLRRAFEEAIRLAERRVRRNYKTAIPMYSPPRDRIQLLLPLCIVSKEKADLALLVDPFEQVNMAWTVLTLDMAYNNARLIAKPDTEWLNPWQPHDHPGGCEGRHEDG